MRPTSTMGHESLDRQEVVTGSSNRSLGIVFAIVFLIIGTLPLVSGGPLRLWGVATGAVFLAIALLLPRALAPLNRLWTRFGLLLHKIVSPIVLGIMFFVVITPIGLLMRAFGKDALRLRFDATANSYWVEREPPGPPPESLDNQF